MRESARQPRCFSSGSLYGERGSAGISLDRVSPERASEAGRHEEPATVFVSDTVRKPKPLESVPDWCEFSTVPLHFGPHTLFSLQTRSWLNFAFPVWRRSSRGWIVEFVPCLPAFFLPLIINPSRLVAASKTNAALHCLGCKGRLTRKFQNSLRLPSVSRQW